MLVKFGNLVVLKCCGFLVVLLEGFIYLIEYFLVWCKLLIFGSFVIYNFFLYWLRFNYIKL